MKPWPFPSLILLMLCGVSGFAQRKPLLQITSPPSGTVVSPGQTVRFTVKADPALTYVAVMGRDPLGFGQRIGNSPEFFIAIPANTRPGRYKVTALAPTIDHRDDVEQSESIILDVESPLAIKKLSVSDSSGLNVALGLPASINVIATLSDGSEADVSNSTRTTYQSDNPSVATVDEYGTVNPVAVGTATITISAPGASATLPVIVELPFPERTQNQATRPKSPEPKTANQLPKSLAIASSQPDTRILPRVSASTSPKPDGAGRNSSEVTVTVTATNENGAPPVQSIYLRLTGAQIQQKQVSGNTASVVISADGTTVVRYFALDEAGKMSEPQNLVVQIARTGP